MKAKQWLIGLLVLLVAVGALWNRYFHSKIRMASEAEIRALAPAGLLPTEAPDVAGGHRFYLLSQVCKKFKILNDGSDAVDRQSKDAIRLDDAIAASAMQLVRQGLARPESREEFDEERTFSALSSNFEDQASEKGAAGDSVGCEKALEETLILAPAFEHAADIWDAPNDSWMPTISAADAVRHGWLKLPELRKLIRFIPSRRETDQEYREALRKELAGQLFDPDQGLPAGVRQLPVPESGDKLEYWVERSGNFDELETAGLMIDLFGEMISNVDRPWTGQQHAVETRIGRLMAKIPIYGVNSFSSSTTVNRLRFVTEMDSTPNSNGIKAAAGLVEMLENITVPPQCVACHNELLRLLAAMWAFKEEHGTFPLSIEELVRLRYLDQVPVDPFADKPLIYDLKSKAIYSAGPDLSFTRAWTSTDDYGLYLVLPKA